MKKTCFNDGWLFSYVPVEDWVNRGNKKAERPVTLPHDFKLELTRTAETPAGPSEGFYPGGVGYYEKTIHADEEMCAGRVLLLFDGAYRLTSVRVNRNLVTTHQGGYSAFFADLTGRLHPGENKLSVTVDASMMPASRWYSGAGLYRDVTLLTGGDATLDPWGVCVQTDDLQTVRVTAAYTAPAGKKCTLRHTVLGSEGNPAASGEDSADKPQTFSLANARVWSPDDPYLYTLRTELLADGQVMDTHTTRFGIRTIRVDGQEGFVLNGHSMKLKGGCVHHDNGVLGAKSHPDAERRKVRKLKENGYNAIRCAHNPPSSVFLDACDELGMLVIDEAFDCWREGKKQLDDHIFFEYHWQEELRAMILRDRNHPSIVFWSTGNEIVERSGVSDGALWSRRLADAVRELDSTRPVNNAVCRFFEDPDVAEMEANKSTAKEDGMDFWAERSAEFIKPLDVVGYNYMLDRYEKDYALFPERIFMGTESFAVEALDNWQAVQRHPYVLGDFVWTAWDYLGESGIGFSSFEGPVNFLRQFPFHLAYCGDIDICGNKRPQSHYRDFVWSGRKAPYIGVRHPEHAGKEEHLTAWGWNDLAEIWHWPGWEGKPVDVILYADGAEVELLLNGTSLGRQPCGEGERYTARFTVPYAAGTLEAIAWQNDVQIGRATLTTPDAPAAVALNPEGDARIAPDRLIYVPVSIVDAQGRLVSDAALPLTAKVEGAAELYAFGCANPTGDQMYVADTCNAYLGQALAVLRCTGEGPVVLRVQAEGLEQAVLSLEG